MKAKVSNVIAHLIKNGKVVVKMDRASGVSRITITKSHSGKYVLCITPPANALKRLEVSEIRDLLEHNSIFIESWG